MHSLGATFDRTQDNENACNHSSAMLPEFPLQGENTKLHDIRAKSGYVAPSTMLSCLTRECPCRLRPILPIAILQRKVDFDNDPSLWDIAG